MLRQLRSGERQKKVPGISIVVVVLSLFRLLSYSPKGVSFLANFQKFMYSLPK